MPEPSDTLQTDPLGLPRFPYEFVRVSGRCYAFVEPYGLANVGVVVGDHGLVVVDSTLHPYYFEQMKRELDRTFGRPILYLINTHFHRDHTFGNVAVRPQCGIIGHAKCAHLLARSGPQLLDDHRDFYRSTDFGVVRPGIVFETDCWRVPDFDVELEIHLVGGHTHDSCMVWAPEQRVLFAGDTVFNEVSPYVGHWSCLDNFGSALDWIGALKAALRFSPARIVPGHGPLGGQETARSLLRFFEYYADTVGAGLDAGRSLREIWQRIYRTRDFRWQDTDVDTYLYLTVALHQEMSPMRPDPGRSRRQT